MTNISPHLLEATLALLSSPQVGSLTLSAETMACPSCEIGMLVPRAGFQQATEDDVLPDGNGIYSHTLRLVRRIIGIEYACDMCGAIPITYQMDAETARRRGSNLDADLFMRAMFAE